MDVCFRYAKANVHYRLISRGAPVLQLRLQISVRFPLIAGRPFAGRNGLDKPFPRSPASR